MNSPTVPNSAATDNRPEVQHARQADEVMIVPPITATESGAFRSVGEVRCEVNQDYALVSKNATNPEDLCRYQMQGAAFKQHADVLVVDSKETIACKNPGIIDKGPCVKAHGTGYRRRD
jgi:hypothetical protein